MRSNRRPSLCVLMQLLVLMVGMTPALAGQVQLTWDAPDSSTPLAGYMLSYWQELTGIPHSVDVGPQTTYTLDGLENGATYSFAVTAYDPAENESGQSNVVTVTMPAGPTLVNPPPEVTLPGPTVHFTWTDGGLPVAEWWVYVGSSVGANDLLDSGSLGSGLSLRVDGLPTDSDAIVVRLWYLMDGTWQCSDFHYTAAPTP